ncbi:cell division protein FtsL [Rhodovulum adriaticum]|uniref:Cell division protein FtsL n=1 Tax=Rhodovulum adriaticum TaxID=35804 RepID=A0A4R2NWF0_RHOAD|nr:cell division protein FtsL [Rhodovulum adriaticum]MBK1636311.1 cell division protein FtsL [Rhodovulum adriaticum]TCP26312.1 hypothetical protein EV656_102275 [Rhodovulum adriaticum]
MRTLVYAAVAMAVMVLAFWAYRENYATQQALDDIQRLNREIGHLHERRAVLRAEWAYLNRPDRLRALAEMNYDRLRLIPLEAPRFARIDQVAYPAPDLPALSSPVDLRGQLQTPAATEDAR